MDEWRQWGPADWAVMGLVFNFAIRFVFMIGAAAMSWLSEKAFRLGKGRTNDD